MQNERKEILVLSGRTMLIVAMLFIDGLIGAVIYRHHNVQVFQEMIRHRTEYSALLKEERDLKNIVVEKEGAKNWESSVFAQTFPEAPKPVLEE